MSMGKVIRALSLALSLFCMMAFYAAPSVLASASNAQVYNLSGQLVNPLSDAGAKAVVLIFTRTDCPISNRYAPVLQELHRRFSGRGVSFWLVYLDPHQTAKEIRRHVVEYGYDMQVVLDPKHLLVKEAGVHVTPEAAVFSGVGKLLYHGRIDNRYAGFGERLPVATRNDLELTLEAILGGHAVPQEATRAVGCYISDLE